MVNRVDTSRLKSIARIAILDVGGPLLVYNLLRANGFSTVGALILSGVLPAIGVIVGIVRHRRADAVGILVLAGIVVGAILGLVSDNPRLVLDEGSVSTGVFGLLSLGSLTRQQPLMYRLSLEFIGPESRQGREFNDLWQYEPFRHMFRVITAVWGIAYLVEAAARVVIVDNTSTGTALGISKVLPYAVAAALTAWTFGYGQLQKRRGERRAAEGQAAREAAATAAGSGDAETGESAESAVRANGDADDVYRGLADRDAAQPESGSGRSAGPAATSCQVRPVRTLAGRSAAMSEPARASASRALTRIQRRWAVLVSAKPPFSLLPWRTTDRWPGSSRAISAAPSSQTITAPLPRP
jgi:hypothetical protein